MIQEQRIMVDSIGTQYNENLQEASVHPDPPKSVSVSDAVTQMLLELGVTHAFGVSGHGISRLWSVLQHKIQVLHFRHETGAAFAAVESHFASDRPVVVLATTGPGITNTLTGLFAARWEGAKLTSSPA